MAVTDRDAPRQTVTFRCNRRPLLGMAMGACGLLALGAFELLLEPPGGGPNSPKYPSWWDECVGRYPNSGEPSIPLFTK